MSRWVAGLVLVVLFGFAAAVAVTSVQQTAGGPSDHRRHRTDDPERQV
jgi:hypothetical protein